MRSDFRNRTAGLRSRLVRTGLALLLSASLPAQAVIAGPIASGPKKPGPSKAPAVSRWAAQSSQNPEAKIDPGLIDAFSKNGRVSYLVKLRTQADVDSAAKSARGGATPASAELKARSAVISSLRETAEVTQTGLLSELSKARAAGEVTQLKSYWVSNMVSVTSSRGVMERLAKRNDVEKIYLNGKIHLLAGEELKANSLEAAGTPGITTVEWGIQRVGAPAVWDQFGIDGTGVVVASLDTGVQGDHPALINQYRGYNPVTGSFDQTYSWFDAVNGDNTSLPYDDHGHGTHTVGTMVGLDADGTNQIGVAPGAKWIAAKILDAGGSGLEEWILAAGEWLLAPGGDPSKAPDVVNNSWGGGPGMQEWFRPIVQAWRAAGIVPVFANGNDGPGPGTVASPGNYPESIGVGATDISDGLASFSGRGPSPYGEIKPELSAPGVNIRSSVPGSGYASGWSGTSMAAPHVAGAVALLKQADASLTVDEIEMILTSSADPMTNSQYPNVPNNGYGHGILNAYTAVGMVASGIGSVSGRVMTSGDDLTSPSITHTPVTEAFKHTDTPIVAQITDNVAVTAVYLRFRQPGMRFWGIVDMERTAGDHKNGTWSGVIPAEIASTPQIQYYIEAVDYGNNHAFHGTSRNPHVITMLDGITPGYMQNFEGSTAGWVSTGGVWEIGEPTSGPGAAYSGTKVAATVLGGNYPDNANAMLISPPIDLSGGPAALRFRHWYQLENGWDFGVVAVTGDGGNTWETPLVYTGANGSYQEATIDLTAYAGNPAVFVAFVLFSDFIINEPGWYLDDIELYEDTEAPATPTGLTAQATPVGSVALAWDSAPASDFGHYTVYRSSTSGGGYTAIGQTSNTSFADSDTTPNTTYYYVVTASDTFGNESGYSNEATATAANVITRFFDNMEAGPGSWTHSGTMDPWEHGVPVAGPSGANSGVNLWGTNLSGEYANGTNASLITPPISLSGLADASLQFAHWYRLERNFDFGRVEVTTNGGSAWTQLAQYTAPASGAPPVGWESPLIDLTPYVGQTIQVRFRMTSDSSITYEGWYIDDVRIGGTPAGGSSIDRSLSVKESRIAPKKGAKGAKPALPSMASLRLPAKATGTYKLDIGTRSIGISSLPVEASVTVLETGRVVRTSPADGSYQITLPAGTYTLRAEAYGFYPSEQVVEVVDGMDLSANFMLSAMPRGLITGTVTDSTSGEPIDGALVWVAEDLMIPVATTNAAGQFTLDVLAGDYTVEVRHPGHYPASTTVSVAGGSTVNVAVEMEPFIGMPGEIGYDDGSAENAWAFFDAGNGWAVRMTPDRPGQTAFVSSARFFLWDASWPGMGATSFRAAIFDANPDGTPGAMLAGPVVVNDGLLGQWNEVDFSAYGVAVDGDFYVAWIQDKAHPDTPGMGFDESSDAGRTWQFVGGGWSPWDMGGNAMIRAVVNYSVSAPTITAPADGTFTNNAMVDVAGMGISGTIVSIYVDDLFAAETMPAADGAFSVPVSLTEGEHVLTATATVPGDQPGSGTTGHSAPVHVTVDLTNPTLTVSTPAEGAMLNSRLITVSGQALDSHLAGVTVNGTAATVAPDGSFTVEIIGREGANAISLAATDLAGNQTTVVRNVSVDSIAPVIGELEPSTDHDLTAGDTVTVSFNSEPGLALAAFKIVLGGTGSNGAAGGAGSMSLLPGEMAMAEVSPGHYEATWTVPADVTATNAYVEFRAVDPTGNEVRATAPGVLHITDDNQQGQPTAVIVAPQSIKARRTAKFDGTQSSSPNGNIVSYQWQMGDGKNYSSPTVQHIYRQVGTYTVTLTVTDSNGVSATATMTITAVK